MGFLMTGCAQKLRGRLVAAFSLIVVPATALLLTACGGGGSDISIAGGQGPDPVLVEVPIAYVKKPLPVDDQGMVAQDTVTELLNFDENTVGADMFVRDRASPTASEINVTAAMTQGLGDVRDISSSYDGSKFIFAMRGPGISGSTRLPPGP
jgi:hypothetical protein